MAKQKGVAILDVTPEGFGPGIESSSIVSPKIQKRKGETLDEAIAREVGYQIDNGRVKITEDRDGWKATAWAVDDEKPRIIRAYSKQQVLNEVWRYLNPDYVIPKANPGMPEAGLQLDISGKTTPVMPKGKARYATADMEAYAKLQKARAEASPKEIFGTLSHEDASELIAGLDLRIDALEGRVDEGKATLEGIKGGLNPKVAKLTALIPATKEGRGEITHITKGQYKKVWGREPKQVILTPDGKRVRWEYALDEIAQELHLEPIAQAQGKAPDEYLKELIEEAKDTKELIAATESEIRSDESTLKALDKLKDTIKARTGKTTSTPFLQKLAHPKIKVTAKPKPATRAKTMLAGVAQALIEKTQAKRTPRAISMDNAILAKQVVPVSKVEMWAKRPNRLDIRGVDTPSRKGKRKPAKKLHRITQSITVGNSRRRIWQ